MARRKCCGERRIEQLTKQGLEEKVAQKKVEEETQKTLIYFFCPVCDELRAIRLLPREVVVKKCDKCSGKLLKFTHPHSMNKLRNTKQQRGF